jgi:hypothetical protein
MVWYQRTVNSATSGGGRGLRVEKDPLLVQAIGDRDRG